MHIINPYRYAAAGGGGGVPVVEAWAASNTGGTSGTLLNLTAPSGITSGELLVAICGGDANLNSWVTPTDWTQELFSGNNSANVVVFWKISDGGETDLAITYSTGADLLGWYIRISGENSTPIDVSGIGTGASSTHVIAEVTTTVADCLVLYGLVFDGGDGVPFSVAGTGWTETDEQTSGTAFDKCCGCFGTKEQATAGVTGDATVTSNVSDGASYFQLAIAPA